VLIGWFSSCFCFQDSSISLSRVCVVLCSATAPSSLLLDAALSDGVVVLPTKQARSHRGAFEGSAPTSIFCAPPNCVVPTKICFKHTIKKTFPPKKHFTPLHLKIWLRAWTKCMGFNANDVSPLFLLTLAVYCASDLRADQESVEPATVHDRIQQRQAPIVLVHRQGRSSRHRARWVTWFRQQEHLHQGTRHKLSLEIGLLRCFLVFVVANKGWLSSLLSSCFTHIVIELIKSSLKHFVTKTYRGNGCIGVLREQNFMKTLVFSQFVKKWQSR